MADVSGYGNVLGACAVTLMAMQVVWRFLPRQRKSFNGQVRIPTCSRGAAVKVCHATVGVRDSRRVLHCRVVIPRTKPVADQGPSSCTRALAARFLWHQAAPTTEARLPWRRLG